VGSSRAEEAAGERERRENVGWKKNRGEAGFLAYFGPDFLLPQAIKSTSIYRRWKREILSTLEKNCSPDSDEKDPNRWLKVGMVHCQIVKSAAADCLSWPLWGGAMSVYLPVCR
jgi:hypothetical protein